MLHGAIFLATCNATMTNKNPFKRGCHTFATFFATCNAYNNKQDGEGMLHASNLSRNVAKSRGSFYFSCNSQRNNCSCKMGCYTWIFSYILQRNVCCVASCKKNCFVWHGLKSIKYFRSCAFGPNTSVNKPGNIPNCESCKKSLND